MILLDGVSKTYPGDKVPALDNVSLHISPNEFVFIVGKSGAGKSTLTKMITKEERQDSGKIIVGGIDLDYVKRRHIPHYRRRLGVVFQDFKLLPKRTVYENVAFVLEIAGMSDKEIRNTVPKVLELVGLSEQSSKFPDQLSGGQVQRVSIARSVARQPKILIADEPTANLDQLTTKEIIELLQKINDFGTTLLVNTHDESIVNYLQKRVITMENGRIISDQKTHGLYRLNPEGEIQKPGARIEKLSTQPLQKPKPTAPKPIQKPAQKTVPKPTPKKPVTKPRAINDFTETTSKTPKYLDTSTKMPKMKTATRKPTPQRSRKVI
ncbi:ATP-binding cassette domain-containing protein [Candidatus Saccharibacteria bacterium]|nr:ATP-binding cassette domain-containing protein [Candidatus Saccharibacteria bacterium]